MENKTYTFSERLASAMAYDQLMTKARRGDTSPEIMASLNEKAQIIGRNVQADLIDPSYEEVD